MKVAKTLQGSVYRYQSENVLIEFRNQICRGRNRRTLKRVRNWNWN